MVKTLYDLSKEIYNFTYIKSITLGCKEFVAKAQFL